MAYREHSLNPHVSKGRLCIALALSVLLSACAGRVAPYSPGNDLLVQASLERALNAERIAYKRNYQGEYLALDESKQSRLVQLGTQAKKLQTMRETLPLSSACANSKMRAYLRSSGAIYVVSDSPDGSVLQMTAADFARLNVAERYRDFERDCSEESF
tara:strand:+ start:44484 stop:44957 length:474 start_codon:yes stop_codon:yes gene_type:complete